MTNQITPSADQKANEWGMFVHFSIFAGYVVPMFGLILPIILWQMKKDEYARVDQHGKNVINWMISSLIYLAVSLILCIVLIGFVGIVVLVVLGVVFPIIGGIKANNGEVWKYPLAITFLK